MTALFIKRLELPMGHTSRSGLLTAMAAAAGAFGVAAMMSTATAASARADAFTDIINAVEGDYTAGSEAFTLAETDFGSNELAAGLASLFNAIDDDTLSPPDNLIAGTVEALNNESVNGATSWGFTVPSDFSDALTNAETYAGGSGYFTLAEDALNSGGYGLATYYDLLGADVALFAPLEELLLGAAVSF
jgi:hypothetical protein